MKYELCMRDEYGDTSILGSNTDREKLVKQAKDIVHDMNVNNPLTAEEKKRNWQVYFAELTSEDGELVEDAFYAGKNSKGQHVAQTDDNDFVEMKDIDGKVQVYLGVLDGEPWYGQTLERRDIVKIDDPYLAQKSVYFIRKNRG
ncbi:MAG: hypothetical protein HC888_00215 [Candidatus Competibacteraceae bacterium]|nr:hypothetical protein [Candidatus Competibacteraceae bacterium]